jgi:hypothetical protein
MLRPAHCTAPKSSGSAAAPLEGRSLGTNEKVQNCASARGYPVLQRPPPRDQCREIQVGFTDSMPEKGQCRGLSGNPFVVLDDHGAGILEGRLDRDRPDTRDGRSLIKAVAAHHPALELGHHTVKSSGPLCSQAATTRCGALTLTIHLCLGNTFLANMKVGRGPHIKHDIGESITGVDGKGVCGLLTPTRRFAGAISLFGFLNWPACFGCY